MTAIFAVLARDPSATSNEVLIVKVGARSVSLFYTLWDRVKSTFCVFHRGSVMCPCFCFLLVKCVIYLRLLFHIPQALTLYLTRPGSG